MDTNNATDVFTGNMYNLYHGLVYSKLHHGPTAQRNGVSRYVEEPARQGGYIKTDDWPMADWQYRNTLQFVWVPVDISLYQMTAAYTTFANQGTFREPVLYCALPTKWQGDFTGRIPSSDRPSIRCTMPSWWDNAEKRSWWRIYHGLKNWKQVKRAQPMTLVTGWFMGVTPHWW